MEGAAVLERLSLPAPARITWRVAAVDSVTAETPRARTIVLQVPDWPGHRAGQHVDLRMTAEDGYQAQRSYSIASAPEDERLALTVARLEQGEVSSYLTGELRAGDELELRGPVGGHFTWSVEGGGPLLLIAGGMGLVPLMAMLRHHAARGSGIGVRALVSARTVDDILYRDELARLEARASTVIHYALTRRAPPKWTGFARRIDADMLREVSPAAGERPRIFVCGPTEFVEHAADLLVALGHDPATVRAERFGPTGG